MRLKKNNHQSSSVANHQSSIIRVVVADDSPFICHLLTQYLESDPAIRVIGTAFDGKQATDLVKNREPRCTDIRPEYAGYERSERSETNHDRASHTGDTYQRGE